MREGRLSEEIAAIHRAMASKLRIPEWILLGYPTEGEWLLKSLFMTPEEMENETWLRRGVSHYNLRVD